MGQLEGLFPAYEKTKIPDDIMPRAWKVGGERLPEQGSVRSAGTWGGQGTSEGLKSPQRGGPPDAPQRPQIPIPVDAAELQGLKDPMPKQ